MADSTLEIMAPILRDELRRRMKKDAPLVDSNIFDLHIVPNPSPNLHARGGTIVNIYVSGLNIVGGPTRLDDPDFWKDLVRFTRSSCKQLYEPHSLVARQDLVILRNFRLRTLLFKKDIAERIPGLLDKKDIKIVKERCTTTWRAMGTSETVTMTYDLDDATQTFEKARTLLSQKVREAELAEIDREIDETKMIIASTEPPKVEWSPASNEQTEGRTERT